MSTLRQHSPQLVVDNEVYNTACRDPHNSALAANVRGIMLPTRRHHILLTKMKAKANANLQVKRAKDYTRTFKVLEHTKHLKQPR
jgi:hypothetical protein